MIILLRLKPLYQRKQKKKNPHFKDKRAPLSLSYSFSNSLSLQAKEKKSPPFSLPPLSSLRVSRKFAVKFYSSPDESILEAPLIFFSISFSIYRYSFYPLPLKIELESRIRFFSLISGRIYTGAWFPT